MGLGSKLFNGMVWSAFGRISIQVVQFVLGVVLARILSPQEYGVFAILMVFILLSEVFRDSGFSSALIQKKNRTSDDISTVFIFNIAVSLICYAILWFASPYIESFYNINSLSQYIRALSLTIIIGSLYTVSSTLVTINMDFKKLTIISFFSTSLSGVISIYLAYHGFGIWALVYQSLLRSIFTAILIWSFIRWKPSWVFSKSSFKQLFSYGSKILLSSLLETFFSNLNAILIGKYIGTKDLGFYSRGRQFTDVVFGVFSSTFGVLLPGLAPLQDEKETLIRHTRTIVKTSALLTVPIFLGLFVLAEPIINVLLGEKWLMAVPILQIFSFARLITVTSGINLNLLYVIGRTDLILRQNLLKIVIRVILVVSAIRFGIIYIALAEFIATSIHFFINTYYPGKMMNYGGLKQLKDFLPSFISGIIMGTCLYLMTLAIENDIAKLCIAAVIGPVIYLIFVRLFKIKELNLIVGKVKEFINK